MKKLSIDLNPSNIHYDIIIEKEVLNNITTEIQEVYNGEKIYLITDNNVDDYYGDLVIDQLEAAGYSIRRKVVQAGEASKHIRHIEDIYADMVDFNLSRGDLLIALGGGVIGDLGGYIAASYLRGIPYVQIPTTLLAQVDSSVGGKVAVDLTQGKNLVGAFYHPIKVLIDPQVLNTLPDSVFNDGMAEVIKYGAILDKDLYDLIQAHPSRESLEPFISEVIYRSCQLKAQVVEEDARDVGLRMILNFGHTIGHAIEAYYNYQKYTHGQGVAIGMVTISQLAEIHGLTPKGTAQEISDICQSFNLPVQLDRFEDYTEIIPLIQTDKKNLNGQLNLILLEKIGRAKIYQSNLDFFEPLIREDTSWT